MKKENNSHILEAKNLTYKYTKSDDIFMDLNFKVRSGEILNLLGPNGCGKSTLLNCLINLYTPQKGEIFIDGTSSLKLTDKEKAQAIGYVPQSIIATFDYSVLDYVVCGVAPHLKMFKRPGQKEYQKAHEALEKMNISYLAQKSYARISGGEQQLVSIARVLTQKPQFILLDEPTSHLDFGNSIKTLKIIKQMSEDGYGIIMTTHHPDHALMLGGKTLIMKDCNNYKFGDTKEIVTEESLRNLYGIKLFLEKSLNAQRLTCVAPSV